MAGKNIIIGGGWREEGRRMNILKRVEGKKWQKHKKWLKKWWMELLLVLLNSNQLFAAISLAFAHSAHNMSAPSVINPLPTRLRLHWLQTWKNMDIFVFLNFPPYKAVIVPENESKIILLNIYSFLPMSILKWNEFGTANA